MKPTKMRNRQIYRATFNVKSKQLTCLLSKDLRRKYGKRSARIMIGDSITVIRGEFKGVDGKVSTLSTENNTVAIEGVKKEKVKGEKFDVYIHASNILITGLSDEDKRSISRKVDSKITKSKPEEPASEVPVVEEPDTEAKSEEPASEVPVVEEPDTEAKSEEPASEVPVVEEPDTEAGKDSKEENKGEK